MTLEPTPAADLPEETPAALLAIDKAVDALNRLDDGDMSDVRSPMEAATVSLAWSNLSLAISEVNRNAAATNLADLASDWAANPSVEGFELFRLAVEQYLVLR